MPREPLPSDLVGQRICAHLEDLIPDLPANPRVSNHHAVPEPGGRKFVPMVRLPWLRCEIFGEQIQLCAVPANICAHKVRKEIPRPSFNLNRGNRIRKRPVSVTGVVTGSPLSQKPRSPR